MRSHRANTPIISLQGPTASGKTSLAIALAEALGGSEKVEIISADAMQLYRGMDIGTAKITSEEMHGIIHHQLDVLDISEWASVAAYQRSARADIEEIWARGKTPLIVGGSGLYVNAVLDELDFPGSDLGIRAQLEEEVDKQGMGPLLAELKKADPVSYQTINHANTRRIIRALEVIRLTGRPFTPRFPRHSFHYSHVVSFALHQEKNVLAERIDKRTQAMWQGGLIEETRVLLTQGLAHSPTAARATGYAQTQLYLEGKISAEQAKEDIALRTRQLARKQRTWLNSDPRIIWLDGEKSSDELTQEIVGQWERCQDISGQ